MDDSSDHVSRLLVQISRVPRDRQRRLAAAARAAEDQPSKKAMVDLVSTSTADAEESHGASDQGDLARERLALIDPRSRRMGDDAAVSENLGLLSRYRRGERAAVWHRLRQLGSRVREPGLLEEVELVCDEMARRARYNVEVLVERLSDAGYRFHSNDEDQQPVVPFVPATEAAAAHAQWLDSTFGPVPLTVLSWVRLVGDVWLVGTHPQAVDCAACDPLVLEIEGSRYPGASMRDLLLEERDVWQEQLDDDESPGLFALPVAPDRLHKDNVSGGAPYGVVVADACADALFVGETTMPFVSYLNRVFASGGFPYGGGSSHDWWRVRRELAKDLLPL